ncbi:MAG: amphi-Trp domain-containing protein [Proteobacteria bacterium]|nr:amphi-Trp domain-containing protein [Desulfobacula sp.]MBU4129705.1 amphi-Trp domain-containing protein [Pseudomonadota bacterium]
MTKRNVKPERDLEKEYSKKEFVAKLRRLADSIEQNKRFRIQISGERICVPLDAVFNIEHEREGKNEEIEFQMKWVMP